MPPMPTANAKKTPITVSLERVVVSRTNEMAAPTATPNTTMKAGTIQDSRASAPVARASKIPNVTPANAQWASASEKKAIRLPTTNEPTAPQMRQSNTAATSAVTFGGQASQAPS